MSLDVYLEIESCPETPATGAEGREAEGEMTEWQRAGLVFLLISLAYLIKFDWPGQYVGLIFASVGGLLFIFANGKNRRI